MKTSGLTKKRMADVRFRRTEQAILAAYCKLRDYPSAKRLARMAGVSRTTLYRHHKKIQAIPLDYEDYLYENYRCTIRKYLKHEVALRTLFLRTLVFIRHNDRVFQALSREYDSKIMEKIFDHLKSRIICDWRAVNNINKAYKVYEKGVIGIIEEWEHHGFIMRELDLVLDDILYLTQSAHRDLSTLH